MNLLKNRLISVLLAFSLCGSSAYGNVFLNAAQDQVNKIAQKPIVHKTPLEFKQAVARYIKNTESHCLQVSQRHTDENVSYKKELRYLFNNYGKFSTAALLSRLRSAHQAMVKHETHVEGDVYKRYEQISSALLIVCAQVFFNDARDQILNTLHELDSLIAYWRYQHHHQISYFFSKSPTKWIVGKNQEQEITHNLTKLERKQRELYTLLGSLTAHVHAFTESSTKYEDCYTWIEELFIVLSCIKGVPTHNLDGTQFDAIAAELELKTKRVSSLSDDFLSSVAFAKKSNHFVRNWIAYTTLIAGVGYAVHCHNQNPKLFPTAVSGMQDSAKYLLVLLLDPLNQIYKRMQIAFSPKVESGIKKEADETKKEDKEQKKNIPDVDMNEDLGPVFDKVLTSFRGGVSDVSKELAIGKETARERLFATLDEAVSKIKSPTDGFVKNSDYTTYFPQEKQERYAELVAKVKPAHVAPIFGEGDTIINETEWNQYQQDLKELRGIIGDLSKATTTLTAEGIVACTKLNVFDIIFEILDDFGEPLKRYTDIIDRQFIPGIQATGDMFVTLAQRGDVLSKEGNELLEEARTKLDEADATLQDLRATMRDTQLTFMFASLIPLITTGVGITKTYQWATKKNYTPIRIALADINALLIESSMQLDDHDYGKLVYLICKLRHKSKLLKSALSNEFLADVAKLESKRYSAQTKRDIVENMFNKYAFLGRIAA